MYKLICGKNPKEEGINFSDGSWMDSFKKHVENCKICRQAVGRLKENFKKEIEKILDNKPFSDN